MGSSSSNQDIFDVRKIRRLVELMNEHDLTEMDIRQGETRIQLRRGAEPVVSAPVARPMPAPAVAASPVADTGRPAAVPPPAAPVVDENITLIKSPMVGTFYAAPDPDSPAYVKVGDMVSADTTVCIIEAMKVFNEIQADVSGKIVAVLVENGEPVEFGKPLFKVDKRG
jgi:acetyl-CoA carboxylase biotin carboxyl carrier protein